MKNANPRQDATLMVEGGAGEMEIDIPREAVGKLIGTRGRVISAIRELTSAEVKLAKDEATGHGKHPVEFGLGWYSPGWQSAHVGIPSSSAYPPGLHTDGSVTPVLHDEHAALEALLRNWLLVRWDLGRRRSLLRLRCAA